MIWTLSLHYYVSCLFGAVKLTKNADPVKYSYSEYGIGFDIRGTLSLSYSKAFGKNETMFGVGKTSSQHANDRKKDILILGKVLTDGLNNM